MPILKFFYICKFGCGFGSTDNRLYHRKLVEEHEKHCSFNPVYKNCCTCKSHGVIRCETKARKGFTQNCESWEVNGG